MTAFEPGEGWREIGAREGAEGSWVQAFDKDTNSYRTWVRMEPAAALPNAQWTVLKLRLAEHEVVVVFDGEQYRPVPDSMSILVDEPQWPVELVDVLATPATPFLPHQGREQAEAWERVAAHPAMQPCHDEDRPLIDAVLGLLDRYEVLDDTDQSLREAQAKETAHAVLASVRRHRKDSETWPGALNRTAHDFGVQP